MADDQTTETTEATEAPPPAQPDAKADAVKAETPPNGAAPAESAEKPAEATPEAPPPPWYGDVDDDLKKVASRFTSPADALRSIADFRKRESQVRVPGKDATDEDRAKYLKAIGVPDKPDGYEFPALTKEELTDQVKESREGWAKTFHEHGVSKDQASALVKAFMTEQDALLQSAIEADKQHVQQAEDALRKEWQGKNYDVNGTLAKRAFETVASRAGLSVDELNQIRTSADRLIMDDPRMARMWAIVGKEMQEGTLGGAVGEDEREGIEGEIQDLQKKIDEARGRGDTATRDRLYQQQLAAYAKLVGSGPIVGSRGRAA